MNFLENRIPPPMVVSFFALIMWLMAKNTNGIVLHQEIRLLITGIFLIVGVSFCIAGIASFKVARTTVNPLKPETASSLVESGIYKVSRNPMYLGLTLILVAWSLYLNSLFSLLGVVGFVFYINQFQIKPEEQALTMLFGKDFLEYKSRVRKWL